MVHYLLQVVVFQAIFLMIYDVFLKRETFFVANRYYLLLSLLLSFIIPFIELSIFKDMVPNELVIVLPEVVIGETTSNISIPEKTISVVDAISEQQPISIWKTLFWIGLAISFLLFLLKLSHLLQLLNTNDKWRKDNLLIIPLPNSNEAFSFFNRIFLGDKINIEDANTIIKHEAVHANQWHTLDLLIVEVLRIGMWFNPLLYIYQQRLTAVHEFIADAQSVKHCGKAAYYQELLNQIFDTKQLSVTNSFYNTSLIKKRIVMLQKSKSKQTAILKYGLLIPVVFAMLVYTSTELKAQEPKTEILTEVVEVQEISEERLIKEYTEKYKKAYEANDFKAMLDEATKTDLYKYRLSLDEFAKVKAFVKVMSDYMKDKTGKEKTRVPLAQQNNNETYKQYLERTKTEAYGRQWETRTKGNELKLYVKDINNKTKDEEERLNKKIDFLLNDPFWESILISDGYNYKKIIISDITSKPKEIDVSDKAQIIDVKETIEVPYATVENIPVFKDCENFETNDERKKCTSQAIAKFVNENFNMKLAKSLGLKGRQRINVGFKIDESGEVKDVFVRAPHPELESEAKRVINLLPKFIPGVHKGKAVTVPYALPIVFHIAEDKKGE